MPPTPNRPEPFDPATATRADLGALHAFTTQVRERLAPGEPPTPLSEAIAAWRAAAVHADVATWLVRDREGAVIARGQLSAARDSANRAVAQGSLDVLAGHRRRGLARSLLAPMADRLRADGRTSVVAGTYDGEPGGEALLLRMGAVRGLETTVHQLRVPALDRARLRAWCEAGESLGDAFALEFREGPHAEADLAEIARLEDVMNTAPMGTLALAHEHRTPAQLRRVEAVLAARGIERWTALVRDRADGRLVGFTEVHWQPHAPELLHQGDTGVFPGARGRGLGRWLKAAMLERVLRERPGVRAVRTTNADANAAMLAINRALGFEPWLTRTVWQAPLPGLEAWLAGGAAP